MNLLLACLDERLDTRSSYLRIKNNYSGEFESTLAADNLKNTEREIDYLLHAIQINEAYEITGIRPPT